MLLSIVIPTYNRLNELLFSLHKFKAQISSLDVPDKIEIIVCDDASTDETEAELRVLEKNVPFISYHRNNENIGLEKNLIESARLARGEYLWIFGDDDFLETDNAIERIVNYLNEGRYDLLILNRTRKSFSLDKVISRDWMGLSHKGDKGYRGLREFFCDKGFISVIGFISVNIMRREAFLDAYDAGYFGTMYPQLGMMSQAFSDASVYLVSEPLICHRTQTAEEKAQAFKAKNKEKLFMSDVNRRDAVYFGAPYIRMLNILVSKNSLSYGEIDKIRENTVIDGRLVDFLFNNIVKAVNFGIEISDEDQVHINTFFSNVSLTDLQVYKLSRYSFMTDDRFRVVAPESPRLKISVVTPSFNQAQFFHECLDSVFEQSYPAIEHIVLDPGSTDGSLNVAKYYKHVTLINEPDEGQGDAVSKGIELARGDIIAWINSDDYYYDSEVFSIISANFGDSDEIVYGNGIFMDGSGKKFRDVYINKDPESLSWRFQQEDGIFQPALFFRKSIIEKIGLPSKYLEYCMDYEYWIRAMKAGIKFRHVDRNFAKAYFHVDNKTYGQRGKSYEQVCEMLFTQFSYVNHIWLKRYAEYIVEGFDGVVQHPENAAVMNKEELQRVYVDLLKRYNTNAVTINLLEKKCSEKGYGDTLRELKLLDLLPSHYKQIEVGSQPMAGFVDYEMGGRLWRFQREWKDNQIGKAHAFLKRAIDLRKNKTCVIVCNGPSLKSVNPELLAKADVIACNNIFLSEEISSQVDFYTCVNYLVAEQSAPQINGLEHIKVLPWWLAYCINESENTYFVDAKGFPEFSTDMFKNMSWRHTVTFFNMHLAYGLGYEKVLLVGCDHSYTQPKGVEEEEIIDSSEDDSNHFHPKYFKSKKWQAADVSHMEEMYMLAKQAFEADDREIVNCTEGGKLELFRRSSLEQEVNGCLSQKISFRLRSPLVGPYSEEDGIHFDETDLISSYIGAQSQGFMIDVGAHHGYAAAPFLKKGWDVLGFEPDPNNRKILKERLGTNSAFVIESLAVSDVAGETVNFYASDESTGISGLSGFTDKHKKICEVVTTTLSDQVEKHKISNVDFLKIDTEGFDLMVLKGFPWSVYKPKIIECEFENAKTVPLGYKFEDIADYLIERGYFVYVSEWHPIVRYGIRHNWKQLTRYPCALSSEDAWGNLLAFESKPDEHFLLRKLYSLAGVKIGIDAGHSKDVDSNSEFAHPNFRSKIKYYVADVLKERPFLHRVAKLSWRTARGLKRIVFR